MTLSVLSALARRDVDPWIEAARLSRLPKETATQQITDFLDGLPRRTLACLDRVEVAARLSALLPRSAASKVPGMPHLLASVRPPPTVFAFNWRFFCLYLCLMLLMNWLMAEFRPPPGSAAVAAQSAGPARPAPETDGDLQRVEDDDQSVPGRE